ncbi:MAG: DUF3419 family protein [Parachlamydiaceae bacterium]|nr:DUF3419 family protein [Parachlamydiaceae bacterium]
MFKNFLIPLVLFSSPLLQAKVSEYAKLAMANPIAFSVVREDSAQDLEVVQRYFSEELTSMLMVASGGDTAALLSTQAKLNDLTIVDPNLSQLQLTKLKMHFLGLPSHTIQKLLGYRDMDPKKRKDIILGLMQALDIDRNQFGDIDQMASYGLDFIGRYEMVFKELRQKLEGHQSHIEQLFKFTNVKEQAAFVNSETSFGQALDRAFNEVMSQDNLVALFGEKATANRVDEFSSHFAERMRIYLSEHLASKSPWMAHLLLGNFYNETFPWISTPPHYVLPDIHYLNKSMEAVLEESQSERYHVIHLSNILDWLSPAEAEKTLQLAFQALKPGGAIIIRQLNSDLDIPAAGKDFLWDFKVSNDFQHKDRSFFYRHFYLGFKPHVTEAPQVLALANQVLEEIPVIQGGFFQALQEMPLETFQSTQEQFFYAVNYFSRPMAALIARLPQHADRIDILHNMVEEHGDFDSKKYHSNTFKKFLGTIGVNQRRLDQSPPGSIVNAFNFTLMGVSANEDPLIAIACNGIIEYAFADISALLGKIVVDRRWVSEEDLVHYNLHADIDKRHAEEFFKIIEPFANDPENRQKILMGLRLGAYIFDQLYDGLYKDALL